MSDQTPDEIYVAHLLRQLQAARKEAAERAADNASLERTRRQLVDELGQLARTLGLPAYGFGESIQERARDVSMDANALRAFDAHARQQLGQMAPGWPGLHDGITRAGSLLRLLSEAKPDADPMDAAALAVDQADGRLRSRAETAGALLRLTSAAIEAIGLPAKDASEEAIVAGLAALSTTAKQRRDALASVVGVPESDYLTEDEGEILAAVFELAGTLQDLVGDNAMRGHSFVSAVRSKLEAQEDQIEGSEATLRHLHAWVAEIFGGQTIMESKLNMGQTASLLGEMAPTYLASDRPSAALVAWRESQRRSGVLREVGRELGLTDSASPEQVLQRAKEAGAKLRDEPWLSELRAKIAYELGLRSPQPGDVLEGLSRAGTVFRRLAQPHPDKTLVDSAHEKLDELQRGRQKWQTEKQALLAGR